MLPHLIAIGVLSNCKSYFFFLQAEKVNFLFFGEFLDIKDLLVNFKILKKYYENSSLNAFQVFIMSHPNKLKTKAKVFSFYLTTED